MLLAAGNAPNATQLETRKALLLIDLQNDFLDPAGKLHVENTKLFTDKIPSLVTTFRQYGNVVWSQTQYIAPVQTISPESGSPLIVLEDLIVTNEAQTQAHQDDPATSSFDSQIDPVTKDPEAFLSSRHAQSESSRCCLPTTVGHNIPESLASCIDHDRDIVQSKSHYSAFHDGGLLFNLRRNLVTNLYICGSLSNIGVYATALDAVRHGFNITVVEDCVGYRSEKCHGEAMRQMADGMGANGIDYQELIDELNGDLGEIVTDDTFPTRFEVSRNEDRRGPDRSVLVEAWMSNVDETSPYGHEPREPESTESDDPHKGPCRCNKPGTSSSPPLVSSHQADQHLLEAIIAPQLPPPVADGESKPSIEFASGTLRTPTPDDPSPPRKRSTSDMDDDEADLKPMQSAKYRRPSEDPPVQPRLRTNRARVRRRPPSVAPPSAEGSRPASGDSNLTDLQQPAQAGNVTSTPRLPSPSLPNKAEELGTQPVEDLASTDLSSPLKMPPHIGSNSETPLLAPAELPTRIGEGDCRLVTALPPRAADATTAFHTLKSEIQWQKMSHRGGEVPRLVAVQGEIGKDGSVPIYRHPADVSPVLHPYSDTVRLIKSHAEEVVGHPLNHVLLQFYRSGEDNISEHSDKTLDIYRGSDIVNVSLGGQRTMTLRRKRDLQPTSHASPTSTEASPPPPPARPTQKTPLPHNSLFVLGPLTNQHWLHSIRADKRPSAQKSAAELAFSSERISLTFRRIATFVDAERNLIWGQGATSAEREEATFILRGKAAERKGIEMVMAFGRENRCGEGWSWEEGYGKGFNVVDFGAREEEERSDDKG